MTKRVFQHEVKLEKSVKIILAALAFGVLAHAFAPIFSANSALATSKALNYKKSLERAKKSELTVHIIGPVNLKGDLDLGGTIKCDGCTP